MLLTSRLLPPSLHQRVLHTACTLARAQLSRPQNCGPAMFLRALSSVPRVTTNNALSNSKDDSRTEANVHNDSNADKVRLVHVCKRNLHQCVPHSTFTPVLCGLTCSFT